MAQSCILGPLNLGNSATGRNPGGFQHRVVVSDSLSPVEHLPNVWTCTRYGPNDGHGYICCLYLFVLISFAPMSLTHFAAINESRSVLDNGFHPNRMI